MLQSSRDKDKIRRIRAEIVEQHEPIMELLSECAFRFNGIPADIAAALTDSVSLPLEEQPAARRAVRDRMLRLLAPDNEEDQQNATDVPRQSRDDANKRKYISGSTILNTMKFPSFWMPLRYLRQLKRRRSRDNMKNWDGANQHTFRTPPKKEGKIDSSEDQC